MADLRFLIIFNHFDIDEKDVRAGTNVEEVVIASRCVNVGLFVSGDLRRNVEVNIAWNEDEDLFVVSFPGWSLKRVSPDERSISFFLLKARNELDRLSSGDWRVMDNGIVVRRTTPDALFGLWGSPRVFKASSEVSEIESSDIIEPGVFVYNVTEEADFSLPDTEITSLKKPHSPERYILDINLRMDTE